MAKLQDTPIYQIANRFIEITTNEGKTFKDVLDGSQKIKDLILFLQTESQLGTAHVDSKGVTLFNRVTGRSTYAESDPLGRGGQPYEVFRTGEYWDSQRVTISEDGIDIQGNPIKQGGVNLFEIYGSDLEGLTEESIEVLRNEIIPAYQNYIRQRLTQ